jgi:hypothetical protein
MLDYRWKTRCRNCKPAQTLVPGHGSNAISSQDCSLETRGSLSCSSRSTQVPPALLCGGGTRLRVQFRGLFSTEVSMVAGEGFLQDLSHYGCRLVSDISLHPGTELELR